jgi:hypothetical protein
VEISQIFYKVFFPKKYLQDQCKHSCSNSKIYMSIHTPFPCIDIYGVTRNHIFHWLPGSGSDGAEHAAQAERGAADSKHQGPAAAAAEVTAAMTPRQLQYKQL